MKRFADALERIAKKTIELFALFLFFVITILGAFRSAYLKDGYGQKMFFYKDSLLLNLLFAIVLLFIMKIIADWIVKDLDKRRRMLLLFTLAYTFCLSLGWAAVSKSFPTADQASVYYGAKHFAADYFAEIAEKNSYFSCYPHQMGLALFYEVILRIFHTESFHLLQAVNAVCNCVTVLSLYKICTLLFEEKKISIYFLLLVGVCFPLFWYTPFVYGELPSFAFSFFGVWMLLEAILGKGEKKFIFPGISLGSFFVATLVRKNTLILIIAVVLALGVYLLKTRKYFYAIYLGLLILMCSQANNLAIKSYEIRSGNQLNDGVPGISHVVMGLQESEYAPGWYNGFNFVTYTEKAGYDQKEAVRLSLLALNERLDVFKSDPTYAINFFTDKFMAEWLNTGYACFDSTAGKYYERLPVVESLYSGNGFYVARFFMDKYQFVIYFLALLFIACNLGMGKRKNRNKPESEGNNKVCSVSVLHYILLATVLGGAVFYLAWEGSGRYILPYFVMTIPYAAAGLEKVDKWIFSGLTFKKKKTIV